MEMTEENGRCQSILYRKKTLEKKKKELNQSYPVTSNLSRAIFAGTETSKCATK